MNFAGAPIATPRISGSRYCDSKARELWRGLRFQVLGTVVDAHTSHSHPGFCIKAQHQQKAFPCSLAEIPGGCAEVSGGGEG